MLDADPTHKGVFVLPSKLKFVVLNKNLLDVHNTITTVILYYIPFIQHQLMMHNYYSNIYLLALNIIVLIHH